jgi:hypothetical protein
MKTQRKKTRAMNYKRTILALLAILPFSLVFGQSESEVRNFIRTAHVSKETTLEVINKYGSVHITPWNKDSAYIRAEVKAFASGHDKLKKMFDGVSININEASNLLRAETNFTQSINMLFESFKGMTSKLISYDSRVEINYYINIPDYLNLKIENKYGDVYMEDNSGNLTISVSNGSFKANSIGKESSLTLTFCDATINSIASGKINSSFSEIYLGETENINIGSISSRYEIKKAGYIQTESRRDKFFIDNMESLKGDSYFTDFKISNIRKEIDLTSKYGSLNIDNIEKKFETVTINSGYSDISLRFEQGSSFGFDIRRVNSFLTLPDKEIKSEEKALNPDKKEYMTFGTMGKNPGNSKVKIDATRGSVYIR